MIISLSLLLHLPSPPPTPALPLRLLSPTHHSMFNLTSQSSTVALAICVNLHR